ncbi:MAG: hypothetical protein RL011_958 [Pseudomonadota bacterium]
MKSLGFQGGLNYDTDVILMIMGHDWLAVLRFSLILGKIQIARILVLAAVLVAGCQRAYSAESAPISAKRDLSLVLAAAVDRAQELEASRIVPTPTDEVERLRLTLLRTAERMGELSYVPYVWGGSAIGNRQQCEECRACREQTSHLPSARSAAACEACEQCGIDCSHFVHRLMSDAGLSYPYMATEKLRHMTQRALRSLNLVDIGRDLRKALPGDLLLQNSHVVLLLAKTGAGRGDVIHVNRSFKHGEVGGIEVLRDTELSRVSGRVVRILRHTALVPPATKASPAPVKPARLVARSGTPGSRVRGR